MDMLIKVMSFNIRTGAADDGENNWQNRKKLVVERIRAFDPDLIGLQECHESIQAGYLKEMLSDYQFAGVRRGDAGDPGIEITAILYKSSVFSPVSQRTFWLSETPEVPGSKSWDSAHARTVEQVSLISLYSTTSLTFINTHFDYVPSAAQESARLLRSQIDALGTDVPLILTGDFNAPKDSQAYHLLTGETVPGAPVLHDTHRSVSSELSTDLGSTFHDFGRAKTPLSIDWILITDHFEVLKAGIDRYQFGTIYPSDHYPIWSVLKL